MGKLLFQLLVTTDQNVYAELFDGDGVTELAGSYSTSTGTYEQDGLAAGTYYIRIRNFYNSEWAPYTLSNSITSTRFKQMMRNLMERQQLAFLILQVHYCYRSYWVFIRWGRRSGGLVCGNFTCRREVYMEYHIP
jgi:hypothetical protein